MHQSDGRTPNSNGNEKLLIHQIPVVTGLYKTSTSESLAIAVTRPRSCCIHATPSCSASTRIYHSR